MIKFLFKISIFIIAILGLFMTYGVLNGASCQYTISMHIDNGNRDMFMTCYRGKVVAILSKSDEDGSILSKWQLNANQLRFGNQSIFVIQSRIPLIEGKRNDENDLFNQLSSGYSLMFYYIQRNKDNVYLFYTFPRYAIHKGKIEGRLDLWDNASE